MNKTEKINSTSKVSNETAKGTKVALWWLRHYESIIHFWIGFSWVWVIGIILSTIAGRLDLRHALWIIFCIGVIANTGMYLGIRTMNSYLKNLKGGSHKDEAYKLMIKIIKKRVVNRI